MTVWSTPVPYYLANQGPRPESGLGGTMRGQSAEDQQSYPGQQQQQQQDPQNQQVGVAGDWDMLAGDGGMRASVRRHSLGSIPTAAKVIQKQESWMAYAPTSPERRRSFVTEPGAIEGNPFEIYKEPEHNNDALQPNTFYEAGTSYSVRERPVALDQSSFLSQTASFSNAGPYGSGIYGNTNPSFSDPYGSGLFSVPSPKPRPVPLHSDRLGDYVPETQLSPVRYNKPAPKVVLSPSTASHINTVFGDLDPFKGEPSPRSRVPLNELPSSETLAQLQKDQQQQQQQQQQPQQQFQQQQEWGFFSQHPTQQQQPQQQQWGVQQGFPQQQPPQGSYGFGGFPVQTAGLWPTATPAAPNPDAFGFPPATTNTTATATNTFMPWAPKSPRATTAKGGNDFDFDLFGAPTDKSTVADKEKMKPFSSGSSGGAAPVNDLLDGIDTFDPVKQKSIVDNSFDLNVSGYFPENHTSHRRSTSLYDDDDFDGPEDDATSETDEHDGGDQNFELQDDQLHDEGVAGAYYEVNFTQPSQFGMLLERKDEWMRGSVKRRERTVVTLVVDGGEAERKGVTVGSLLVSINGVDVTDKTYKETLELIKSPERPMLVLFEKESLREEVLAGYFFVSKGPFFSTPTSMENWKRKYVVLGGPIAKKNVLQIYDSKKAYHNTVVALFQRKRPYNRVKTYPLTYAYKCSNLEERCMKGNSAPLKLFSFMTPQARFKSIRVASESRKQVQELYDRVRKFSGKK